MKYIIYSFFGLAFLFSCQSNSVEEYPTDLNSRKELLKAKKGELKETQKLIDRLLLDIEKEEPSREKPRKTVSVSSLKKQDFKRFAEIQANVEAEDLVAASSETGGRLTMMKWKEGEYIKKGQLVAKIDMESVNKQIAELQTSRTLAQDVFDRQKRLWDQKIGTEIQFLQAKNNLERIDKSLETVGFQLTKSNVYSPASGYVDMVIAKLGEMTAPGSPIIQILNTSQLKVVASLTENYLGKIKRGQMVDVQFPALDLNYKAKVSLIGRTIDPANRTFKIEIKMPNTKGQLKPNLLATILVNDYTSKDAIVVPLELVQEEISGKKYVLIKGESKEGSIAEKRYVETGETYLSDVEILSGLEQNDSIIVDGARSLTDQELISVAAAEKAESK